MPAQLVFLATYAVDSSENREVAGGPLWRANLRAVVCDTFAEARDWGLAWAVGGKACIVQTLRLDLTLQKPVHPRGFKVGWTVAAAHFCTPEKSVELPDKLRWDASLLAGVK